TAGKAVAINAVSRRGRVAPLAPRKGAKLLPKQNPTPARGGKAGDKKGDKEKERRIMPAIERHLAAAEHGLFGGVLQRRIVGLRRAPLPGQLARGIDVGEIGTERFAVAVDKTIRQRNPARDRERTEAEQGQAVAARARYRQPVAGSQALPEMSHFAA